MPALKIVIEITGNGADEVVRVTVDSEDRQPTPMERARDLFAQAFDVKEVQR